MKRGSKSRNQRAKTSRLVSELVSTGFRFIKDPSIASKEVEEHRLSICKGCEHWDNWSCRRCTCPMRFKITLSAAKCIEGKW